MSNEQPAMNDDRGSEPKSVEVPARPGVPVSRIRTEADVLRLFDQAQDFAEVNDYKRAAGLLRLAEKAMTENGIKVSAETKTNIERLGSSIDGHLK